MKIGFTFFGGNFFRSSVSRNPQINGINNKRTASSRGRSTQVEFCFSPLTERLKPLLVHLQKSEAVAEDDLAPFAEPSVPHHHQMSSKTQQNPRKTQREREEVKTNKT